MKYLSALKLLSLLTLPFIFFFLVAMQSTESVHAQQGPSLTFNPENVSVPPDSKFTTDIFIDTASQDVSGAGIIFNYDPYLVQIEYIDTYPIFDDFPTVAYDNSVGHVIISGIKIKKDSFFNGKATIATVGWKSVSEGSATVMYEFTPGNTRDSNIAVQYANGDILSWVNTLQIQINRSFPAPVSDVSPAQIGDFSYSGVEATPSRSVSPDANPSFFQKVITFFTQIPKKIFSYFPFLSESSEEAEQLSLANSTGGNPDEIIVFDSKPIDTIQTQPASANESFASQADSTQLSGLFKSAGTTVSFTNSPNFSFFLNWILIPILIIIIGVLFFIFLLKFMKNKNNAEVTTTQDNSTTTQQTNTN